MKNQPATQEWSHNIPAGEIPAAGLRLDISADARQCRDVARRLRVGAVEGLAAHFDISRESGSALILVRGAVSAKVTQDCVVSGQKMVSEISEDFEAFYADSEAAVSFLKARHERLGRLGDELQMLEEHDDPEPLSEQGEIDLGELAVQYLSLAVAPYPRSGEAAAVELPEGARLSGETHRPFAALKNWKQQGKD
jgi:hypothetical protein